MEFIKRVPTFVRQANEACLSADTVQAKQLTTMLRAELTRLHACGLIGPSETDFFWVVSEGAELIKFWQEHMPKRRTEPSVSTFSSKSTLPQLVPTKVYPTISTLPVYATNKPKRLCIFCRGSFVPNKDGSDRAHSCIFVANSVG
jgi:hypothetical protein